MSTTCQWLGRRTSLCFRKEGFIVFDEMLEKWNSKLEMPVWNAEGIMEPAEYVPKQL